jgi:hypothetical protein
LHYEWIYLAQHFVQWGASGVEHFDSATGDLAHHNVPSLTKKRVKYDSMVLNVANVDDTLQY